MNKYEQLIEFIINEQEDKARELFHQIVVEKSRDIYENLIDENEPLGGDPTEELMRSVEADGQAGLPEAEDEFAGDMSMDMDDGMDDGLNGGDEFDGGEFGDEGDGEGDGAIEDRVMDLETALDELKAEFDALMADEEGEPEHGDGENDPEFGSDSDADDSDEEPTDDEDENMIREYVDKVGHDWDKNANKAEGKAVGARADSVTGATHTKSPGSQKPNNMGGTAPKMGQAGESAPDGQRPTGKAGGFLSNPQEIAIAKRNVNKPGGNKGAQNYYDKKETSYESNNGAEGQTTDGKLPVNPKALQGGRIR